MKAFVTQTAIADSFYCADRFSQAQFKTIETNRFIVQYCVNFAL